MCNVPCDLVLRNIKAECGVIKEQTKSGIVTRTGGIVTRTGGIATRIGGIATKASGYATEVDGIAIIKNKHIQWHCNHNGTN